jgi:hypothetical protein
MSLIVYWFQSLNLGLRHVFPPYLSMLIINIMNTANLVFLGYFVNGATFDTAEGWGFFSIIRDDKFALFLYTVIILCTGTVASFTLVAKLFPNFVVPTMMYFLEPGIVTVLFHFSNVQALPGSFSFIGYTLMTPGMGMILIGQWIFTRFRLQKEVLLSQSTELKELLIEPESKKLVSFQSSVESLDNVTLKESKEDLK